MESLDASFLILIDGKPLAKPNTSGGDRTQATAGDGTLASCKLENGVLECDGWILGRLNDEDESLGLKEVMWLKKEDGKEGQLQAVTAEKNGNDYKLLFGGAPLVQVDGKVSVNLQQETSTVQVMMQSK
ncbi:hypothetical protein DE146DRAFT_749854 [Phaeosphaeria sp. MPI-PUGE-AT-0046c]|nr:hypothetical protein DE146DRAFT_749854 [Phaeosphaeria sp. MPI-PUGE-AT-0046c]